VAVGSATCAGKATVETPSDRGVLTDHSKIGSYLAKDLLAIKYGKKIFENCDRQKEQAGASQIASGGDVRCWKNACRGIQTNWRKLAFSPSMVSGMAAGRSRSDEVCRQARPEA